MLRPGGTVLKLVGTKNEISLKNVAYLQKFNFEIVNKISGLFGVFQEVIT